MRKYRNKTPKPSSSKTTTTDPPVQPAPVPVVRSTFKPAPTRFRIQDSVFNKKTHNEFTVEAEFQKYISDSMSSEESSILWFWEVIALNGI
jgi:hypothetical protein